MKDNDLGLYLGSERGSSMETVAKFKPDVEVLSDVEMLARRCVGLFVADAQKTIAQKEVFYLAISGGNTPRPFFNLLGQLPEAISLPWDHIHLFWVDERYVPFDSEASNYKLAADTFLKKVNIPQQNVHRVQTEQSDFKQAAMAYEETIRTIFNLQKNQLPQFDLIVLGMGVDGHTGSLFPNSYAPFDKDDLACVVYTLESELNRITLTHPVLRAASHLTVLVSGKEKANILREVLTAEPDEVRYPIHTLWPVLDKITWLVDTAAAKLL